MSLRPSLFCRVAGSEASGPLFSLLLRSCGSGTWLSRCLSGLLGCSWGAASRSKSCLRLNLGDGGWSWSLSSARCSAFASDASKGSSSENTGGAEKPVVGSWISAPLSSAVNRSYCCRAVQADSPQISFGSLSPAGKRVLKASSSWRKTFCESSHGRSLCPSR